MRSVRRHDLSPRIEMMPMIDVIFLLLTFFIYSMVTMVRAEILPVQLQTLTTGEVAKPASIVAITVDARGKLYLNRSLIDEAGLDDRLRAIAQSEDPPKVFLALEDTRPRVGDIDAADSVPVVVDRGPLLLDLIERLRRAGIKDFSFVGDRASP